MKHMILILMALLIALLPCAVAEEAGLANPITEYETLEEVNELAKVNLAHPAVMGVDEESFCTIDCGDYLIGQYVFNVAGREYCFRAAVVSAETDISGYYTADGTAFENSLSENGETEYCFADADMLARWFDGDIQYVLMLTGCEDAEQDWFRDIADEMRAITAAEPADEAADEE